MSLSINIVTLPHAESLPLPTYATDGSAGMDVCAAIAEPLIISPGAVVMVPTGIVMSIPKGYECQVRSRSGLAAKHGVFALNSPGTIDSDFRGEVHVILANFSKSDYIVERGSRIAQLVVAQHEHVQWNVVEELTETIRGEGGFGSTGVHS